MSPGSVGSFRLMGVPIRLHFTFVLLLIFLIVIGLGSNQSPANYTLFMLALIVSVLLHEFGACLRQFPVRHTDSGDRDVSDWRRGAAGAAGQAWRGILDRAHGPGGESCDRRADFRVALFATPAGESSSRWSSRPTETWRIASHSAI